MSNHFAILPEWGGCGVAVRALDSRVYLSLGGRMSTLTPAEARQIATALNLAADLPQVTA